MDASLLHPWHRLKQQSKFLESAAGVANEAIACNPNVPRAHTTPGWTVLRQLGDATGAASESRAGAELAKPNHEPARPRVRQRTPAARLRNAGDLRAPSRIQGSPYKSVPATRPRISNWRWCATPKPGKKRRSRRRNFRKLQRSGIPNSRTWQWQ